MFFVETCLVETWMPIWTFTQTSICHMVVVGYGYKNGLNIHEGDIPFEKVSNSSIISPLFFREAGYMHGLPRPCNFWWNTRFLSHFWHTVWKSLGTSLYSTVVCAIVLIKRRSSTALWIIFCGIFSKGIWNNGIFFTKNNLYAHVLYRILMFKTV